MVENMMDRDTISARRNSWVIVYNLVGGLEHDFYDFPYIAFIFPFSWE